MAWEAELSWAGEFTGHSVLHDLEALVWVMWVFCINMDGPFNKRRFKCGDFEKPPHLSSSTKRIKLEAPSNANVTSKSRRSKGAASVGNTTPKMPSIPPTPAAASSSSNAQDKPPCWSRPGLHSESTRDVAWQKIGITFQRLQFTAFLSPYFAKHDSVIRGFRDLIKLFAWQEVEDVHRNVVRQPPTPTTYRAVVDIIKEMRDGIDGTMDGPPSTEELERARAEFAALLRKGHLETPLLGNGAGPSGSQSQSKKRSLNNDD